MRVHRAFENSEIGNFIQTVSLKENRSDCHLKKWWRTRVLRAFENSEIGDFIQTVSLKENRSDCHLKKWWRTRVLRAFENGEMGNFIQTYSSFPQSVLSILRQIKLNSLAPQRQLFRNTIKCRVIRHNKNLMRGIVKTQACISVIIGRYKYRKSACYYSQDLP